MKPFFTLLLAAALLLAPGCYVYRLDRYVHDPTERVQPAHLWGKRQVLPRKLRPAEGEVLLVPDFETASTGNPETVETLYPSLNSLLHVFTRGNRPILIIDAEFEVVKTGVKQSIALNIMTKPWALSWYDKGYWGASVRLFGSWEEKNKNTDFSKIRGADDLILTVRWRDGDRIVEQRFPLHRSARKILGLGD